MPWPVSSSRWTGCWKRAPWTRRAGCTPCAGSSGGRASWLRTRCAGVHRSPVWHSASGWTRRARTGAPRRCLQRRPTPARCFRRAGGRPIAWEVSVRESLRCSRRRPPPWAPHGWPNGWRGRSRRRDPGRPVCRRCACTRGTTPSRTSTKRRLSPRACSSTWARRCVRPERKPASGFEPTGRRTCPATARPAACVDSALPRTTIWRPRHISPHEEDAMKYLCLIYQDEQGALKVPTAEMEKAMAEYWAFTDDIKKSGHHIASNGLQPTKTATTVRVRNGKVSTTDGPFAETKEQLGGFYLIEAKDLNDAIQVAARIPSARWGSVEVRPIWESQRP